MARTGRWTLLEAMTAAGLGDRIVLGMDAARQGYYRAYGGSPGLTYLLDGFSRAMTERGLGRTSGATCSSTTRAGLRLRPTGGRPTGAARARHGHHRP